MLRRSITLAALFVAHASLFEPLEPLERFNWIGEVQSTARRKNPAGKCPEIRITVRPAACEKSDCRFQSAICVLVRNEARYLAEWLTYHRLVGIDHVYLYDNNSTDVAELRAVTRPFVDSGFLTLHDWSRPELVQASLPPPRGAHQVPRAPRLATISSHCG